MAKEIKAKSVASEIENGWYLMRERSVSVKNSAREDLRNE